MGSSTTGTTGWINASYISVGNSPRENEVVVRFAEALPQDVYRVEVFGVGSTTPLTNTTGDLFVPTLQDNDGDSSKDSVRFRRRDGAAVLPVIWRRGRRRRGGVSRLGSPDRAF